MSQTKLGSVVSSFVASAGSKPRLRKLLDEVLEDDQARDLILHRLGTLQMHNDQRIDLQMPRMEKPENFEDLIWLLSSNYANRGLALLMLEEAVWLYDTIQRLGRPDVAELGRAKGGTTFLMAAAGANVLSLENGRLEAMHERVSGKSDVSYDDALRVALDSAGLSDRVEIVVADAETYPVVQDSYDLIFVDIALPGDRERRLFDTWWPGVKPGGRMVLRDGREPRTPSVQSLAASLMEKPDLIIDATSPGVFVVLERMG